MGRHTHPIKVQELKQLLIESEYDKQKPKYLIDGFTKGFELGYEGPEQRTDTSENLPLNDLGMKTDLWNKVMKEVEVNRYAGPYKFSDLPVKDCFIQSPIGLMPKAGNKTRLIFHLSYEFKNGNPSINACTPKERCHVKYKDLDHAVDACIKLLNKHSQGNCTIFFSKTDIKSAFRLVPIFVKHCRWLTMKVEDPKTGEEMFFIDLCLPFGASISCVVFQAFSDALTHIIEYLLAIEDLTTNYLDDFLFVAILKDQCNKFMRTFIVLCKRINCPLSQEKTEWATVRIIFLGTLLDGTRYCLCIPEDKKLKALSILNQVMAKRTITIKQVQSLTGILNFLNRALVPGRVFTPRMYSKLKTCNKAGRRLKQYHHVSVCKEFKKDCEMWKLFLNNSNVSALCHPFVDNQAFTTASELNFYTDSSGTIGFGCFFDGRWTCGTWTCSFLRNCKPSIEYLELYALCVVILMWEMDPRLRNNRVIIWCDNQAVVSMVNETTSSCRNCMYLLRRLVLNNLKFNRRVFVKYVTSSANILADSLSRCKWETFWKHAPGHTRDSPDEIPQDLKNIEKLWIH